MKPLSECPADPIGALSPCRPERDHGPWDRRTRLLVYSDVVARIDFRAVFAEAARWMGWDDRALFGDGGGPVGYLA